jgi:hypothetical protein
MQAKVICALFAVAVFAIDWHRAPPTDEEQRAWMQDAGVSMPEEPGVASHFRDCSVSVVIGELSQDLQGVIDAQQIKTTIELVLRRSGVRVIDEIEAVTNIYSRISLLANIQGLRIDRADGASAGGYALSIEVSSHQPVVSLPTRTRVFAATLWSEGTLAVAPSDQSAREAVVRNCEALAKEFANLYLKGNPEREDEPTNSVRSRQRW